MKLADLSPLFARRIERGPAFAFQEFRADPVLAPLRWPDCVLEQFLYEHGGSHLPFEEDYGHIDLEGITWRLEMISRTDFRDMPTGASEAGLIDHIAENPVYWVSVRPERIGCHWEDHGTWMRPPLLIDRRLLAPPDGGLQVLEGRTRVGVLRGRLREGLKVAPCHQAWVGRPREASA
ncbi:hypothetical protein OG788_07760 [Streptomyces sp. NBC_00647]|uniref:hypothetical protein n=1 Tax=Streptomyces sp. NBC_00647 TaxID=2975796 RepID=UPI003248A5FD